MEKKDYNKNKKELSNKHLKYLFGDYSDEILEKLTYDYISIYSITPYDYAEKITNVLDKLCMEIIKKPISKLTITEMTACIGGNVISFAKKFKKVIGIELSEQRFQYLNNNLKVLQLNNNVQTICGDSLVEIAQLKQDIIFFDIPWGGRSYKFKEQMNLYISKIPSYNACNLVKDFCKIIVMKIPNNFNLEKFRNRIDMRIYQVVDLEKFKLLILI